MDGHHPQSDLATRLLYALNHPIRIRIIESLMREPASPTTLANAFDMPLGNVSYHLCKVLHQHCEVVTLVKRNPRRGAMEKVFALRSKAYVDAIRWTTIPEPMRSGVRGLALDSFLKTAIAALEAESAAPSEDNLYAWRSVAVDGDGRREIGEAMRGLAEKVEAVEDRCAAVDPDQLTQLIVGTAAFEPAPR